MLCLYCTKKTTFCKNTCASNQICIESSKTCVGIDKVCGENICKDNEICEKTTQTCTTTITSKCQNKVCGLEEICDELTGQCKPHLYEDCNKENGDCTFNMQKKNHGDACTQHEDCMGNICMNYEYANEIEYMFSDGYCTSFCRLGCPSQTTCVENTFTDNYCLKNCKKHSDCREDYQCQNISENASVCMPKKQIVHVSETAEKGVIGSVCESNHDCSIHLECFKTSLSSTLLQKGYCTLLQCDVFTCPAGSKCIELPNDIHACLRNCTDSDNCDNASICINTFTTYPVIRSSQCINNDNCHDNETCFNKNCYSQCDSMNVCKDNERCLGYSAKKNELIQLCSGFERICKPAPYDNICQSHAECGNCENGGDSLCEYLFGAEYTCDTSNFTCQKTCNPHETDCKKEKKYCDMNSQTCIPLCQKDQDCAYSEKCNLKSGQCEKSCNSNDQCREKEFCNEAKICEHGSCKTIGCSSVLYSCNQGNNALTQEQCLPHCGNIFSQTSTISTKGKCPAGFVCSSFGICIHKD